MFSYDSKTASLRQTWTSIKEREMHRGKVGYSGFTIEALYNTFIQTTPRIGFWLDNSSQTPQKTAETILKSNKPI
ncbi:phosphotransferase [bacterium 1xD42-62]|uniref:Phosphotransferase n=1 Tax=Parablautia muri TaxID=2320879 RepID=A0A9X5GS40_9FIRM|nr:phosphotransferase [Parablautia muri]